LAGNARIFLSCREIAVYRDNNYQVGKKLRCDYLFKRFSIIAVIGLFCISLSACRTDPGQSLRAVNPKYNSDELADKWREQYLRKPRSSGARPSPYSYPHDNDSEYYYPHQGGYGNAPYIPPSPRYYPQPTQPNPYYYGSPYQQAPMDFDSSNQYSYPRYDPEADNAPYNGNEEAYEYPMYFDY
jgi:hypothetical protein